MDRPGISAITAFPADMTITNTEQHYIGNQYPIFGYLPLHLRESFLRIYSRSHIPHSLNPSASLNILAPVWFITGASGGLGEILARRALSEGHRVIGTCRDKQRSSSVMEPLRDRGMTVMELDVAGTQQYITTKIQEAISIYGHIDILVNNAGYGALGPLERFTYIFPYTLSSSAFARLLNSFH